jgi:epoxyqueuosine reductase
MALNEPLQEGVLFMGKNTSPATGIILQAESFPGVRAGIASLEDVLKAPSYRTVPDCDWTSSQPDGASLVAWPPGARSVLVLGLNHPVKDPRLDWWESGNTQGNRRLMELSETLKQWLHNEHGLETRPLPYHVENGGLFLKDAAVLAGLGVIGRNNLLLHPEWGPRIRLRALLMEGESRATGPLEGFSPCETCDGPCHGACPRKAFPAGAYHRSSCLAQINADAADPVPGGEIDHSGRPIPVIRYCRACELACPVGV